MDYRELNKEIEAGRISNLYLFAGPEEFLRNFYIARIREKVIVEAGFDVHVFEGKNTADRIVDALESCPMFNSNMIIIAKDTGLFSANADAGKEKLVDSIDIAAGNVYIIFSEENVDKRSMLYKRVSKNGSIFECEIQNDEELINWVKRILKKNGFTIDTASAQKLISLTDRKMNSVMNELEKLMAYKRDEKKIGPEDIELTVSKSIMSKIFDLTGAVADRNAEEAYRLLDEMIRLKEPEQKILYMISTNFIDIYNALRLGKEKKSTKEIAAELSITGREWLISKYQSMGKKIGISGLRRIISFCARADEDIKTGKSSPRLSIELLIARITGIKTY